MSEIELLRDRIEELRAELHKLAENTTMTDQELLTVSQALDATINEYYQLLERGTGW